MKIFPGANLAQLRTIHERENNVGAERVRLMLFMEKEVGECVNSSKEGTFKS